MVLFTFFKDPQQHTQFFFNHPPNFVKEKAMIVNL